MSVYTTQVRWICEQLSLNDEQPINDIPTIIRYAVPKIFKWPISWYNNRGNEIYYKILAHYYIQEIGLETPALWQWKMYEHLQLVAPYYNQLYESAAFKYEPLQDYDMTKTHTGSDEEHQKGGNDENGKYEREGSTSNEINKTTNHTDLYSNTPQNNLQQVVEGKYLTDARAISDKANEVEDGSENSNTNQSIVRTNFFDNNGSNQFTETIKGKLGGKSYQQLISEYRDLILNIDEQIVKSCQSLFMLIWEVF